VRTSNLNPVHADIASFQHLVLPFTVLARLSIPVTIFTSVKSKAIPLQAWTGSEVSRRLRLPDFKTIGT
jgi:hypothetical protein